MKKYILTVFIYILFLPTPQSYATTVYLCPPNSDEMYMNVSDSTNCSYGRRYLQAVQRVPLYDKTTSDEMNKALEDRISQVESSISSHLREQLALHEEKITTNADAIRSAESTLLNRVDELPEHILQDIVKADAIMELKHQLMEELRAEMRELIQESRNN